MDNYIHLDLSEKEVSGISGFLGYGQPERSVWFIGLEEGLGKSTDAEARENLRPRSRFQRVMDLRDAHLTLKENQAPIDIETKATFTAVWIYAAKIMLAMEGHKDWSSGSENRKLILESAKDYVRFKLGRRVGRTFLSELSPIPTKSTADLDWMCALRRVDSKLDDKIEYRKSEIKRLLKASDPSRVICYGKRATEFAALLGIEWHSIDDQISSSRDGKCLLLPFFGNGQMSHSVIGTLARHGLLQEG
jgi:hypothetical protein